MEALEEQGGGGDGVSKEAGVEEVASGSSALPQERES